MFRALKSIQGNRVACVAGVMLAFFCAAAFMSTAKAQTLVEEAKVAAQIDKVASDLPGIRGR